MNDLLQIIIPHLVLAEMKQWQKATTLSSGMSIISETKDGRVPKKNFMKHLWFKGYLYFNKKNKNFYYDW